jgi:hypothetical protein
VLRKVSDRFLLQFATRMNFDAPAGKEIENLSAMVMVSLHPLQLAFCTDHPVSVKQEQELSAFTFKI